MKKNEGLSLEQRQKEKEERRVSNRKSRPGYGNKKLKGPDRPST